MQQTTAQKQPFTKKEKSWILYDVANSAYVMLATALLSLYFKYLSPSENLSTVWGLTNVIVTIIAVFLCPILGTYADFSKKKSIFLSFALIGIISCAVLSLFSFISKVTIAGLLFLIIYIIAEVGFASANVFYDSMLNDITTDENMHRVSANGYAWGYICSCIPFAFCLLAYVLGTMVPGLEWFEGYAFTIGCLITAAWWLFFTIPLLKNYEQKNFMPRPEKPIRATFQRLGSLFAEFKKNKKALLFLVAFFFYIDGVHTIIKMATALGTDLGFDQVKLVIMLFVTQFVAFPCALIFGKLSSKVPCEKLLLVAISAYTAIGVFTVFLAQEWQCWILVVSVGMFQGGVQAMSRSYFTKLVPADKTGEFFGIYDIFGKSAAILGLGLTSLLGIFYPLSESNGFNVSLLPLPVLFAIGLVLFLIAMKIPAMKQESSTETIENDQTEE